MEITVESKQRKSCIHRTFIPRGAEYLDVVHAVVQVNKTRIWLQVSRYSTEKEWYLDCQFTNKLPDFNHGEGSRCCMKKVAQNDLLEAIEKAPFTDG